MTSSDLIVINSKNRLSGNSNDLMYTLSNGNALKGTYELVSFHMSNLLYTVVLNENDYVYFNYNNVNKYFQITPGYYSFTDLAAHLQTRIRTESGNAAFTVSYSSSTGKLTFTDNSATNFRFLFSTNSTSTARYLLGFNAEDTTNAVSLVSSNPCDIRLHDNICIDISQDNNRHARIDGAGISASFLIPMSQSINFGDTINFVRNQGYSQYCKFEASQYNINIKLYSTDGDTLQNNGAEFVLCLKKIYD